LEVEGEMRADAALMPDIRQRIFPNSMLTGQANLFIMPDQDAAHIAFNMTRVISKGVNVGPILMGASRPAHVLTPSATVRRVVNMTAIAVYEAQQFRNAEGAGSSDG
ncbi:MAG: phosphate acyltransferase, partial [Pseudomonadota bacterium]